MFEWQMISMYIDGLLDVQRINVNLSADKTHYVGLATLWVAPLAEDDDTNGAVSFYMKFRLDTFEPYYLNAYKVGNGFNHDDIDLTENERHIIIEKLTKTCKRVYADSLL